jgi:hypothetical protein
MILIKEIVKVIVIIVFNNFEVFLKTKRRRLLEKVLLVLHGHGPVERALRLRIVSNR